MLRRRRGGRAGGGQEEDEETGDEEDMKATAEERSTISGLGALLWSFPSATGHLYGLSLPQLERFRIFKMLLVIGTQFLLDLHNSLSSES